MEIEFADAQYMEEFQARRKAFSEHQGRKMLLPRLAIAQREKTSTLWLGTALSSVHSGGEGWVAPGIFF